LHDIVRRASTEGHTEADQRTPADLAFPSTSACDPAY
jgi:hypothetical protein